MSLVENPSCLAWRGMSQSLGAFARRPLSPDIRTSHFHLVGFEVTRYNTCRWFGRLATRCRIFEDGIGLNWFFASPAGAKRKFEDGVMPLSIRPEIAADLARALSA